MHNGGPRYSPAPSSDEAEISDTAMAEECNGVSMIEMDATQSKTNTLSSLMGSDNRHTERFYIQDKFDRTLHSRDVVFIKSFYNRRTTLEKYLLAICLLLFIGCAILIAVSYLHKDDMSSTMSIANQHVKVAGTTKFPKLCLTADCVKIAGDLMKSMDRSVDPCDDFFEFSCGAFNRENAIPDDEPYTNTFSILHNKIQLQLRGLLEQPIDSQDTAATTKAKILYKSCLNTSHIETVGDSQLRNVLEDLGGWPVVDSEWNPASFSLEDTLVKLRMKYNIDVFINSGVAIDSKNSSRHIFEIDQSELGIPGRDYYLKTDDTKVLDAYLEYMTGVAVLLGVNESHAHQEMKKVLEFEIQLANITLSATEQQNKQTAEKKITIRDLTSLAPGWSWERYITPQHPLLEDEQYEISVLGLKYIKEVPGLVAKTDQRVIANYVMWIMIMSFVPDLTKEYNKKRMDYQYALDGVTKDQSRWAKCVGFCNAEMGFAVGSMFVKKYFDKDSKSSAVDMIADIRDAFNDLLEDNEWMDDETRSVAKEKAIAMTEKIGYPAFILNTTLLDNFYSKITCTIDDYFGNVLEILADEVQRGFALLTQPVDHETWDKQPAIVNAFYSPNVNNILFPAGILQPLFYSRRYPKSLNYGGIGVVIGHEITHGFDGEGRQYNKHGNIQQWWNNKTIAAFNDRARCVEEQYSNYTLKQINVNINGKLTLGENIADNGGVKQSFQAYRKWVALNGEEPLLPGINMTHNQLFFLNYAQIWCGTMRDKTALKWLRTGVHSPGSIRVKGPLSNSKDFAEAFNCPAGSKMNPIHKCSVW